MKELFLNHLGYRFQLITYYYRMQNHQDYRDQDGHQHFMPTHILTPNLGRDRALGNDLNPCQNLRKKGILYPTSTILYITS